MKTPDNSSRPEVSRRQSINSEKIIVSTRKSAEVRLEEIFSLYKMFFIMDSSLPEQRRLT
jgi:hypothetical protein